MVVQVHEAGHHPVAGQVDHRGVVRGRGGDPGAVDDQFAVRGDPGGEDDAGAGQDQGVPSAAGCGSLAAGRAVPRAAEGIPVTSVPPYGPLW
ncbi:hypothetical protein GCM10020295_46310 [Streptomyces cinereospinus]